MPRQGVGHIEQYFLPCKLSHVNKVPEMGREKLEGMDNFEWQEISHSLMRTTHNLYVILGKIGEFSVESCSFSYST